MTIPNMMTLARMALVPAFLIGVIYGWLHIALVIFVVAAVTDALDGYLARCFHQESQLGLYLDPLADKLLSTVSYVSLAVIGLIPAWLTVVVVFKDLFIGLGIAIVFFTGRKPKVMPTLYGKGTTIVQVITIGAALIWSVMGLDGSVLATLFKITGGMTVLSGGHYILQGFRQLDEGKKAVVSA
ncbi:MAG: CDP-alcohol phosphatidyltransferase family protein [Pedobacter sp.]